MNSNPKLRSKCQEVCWKTTRDLKSRSVCDCSLRSDAIKLCGIIKVESSSKSSADFVTPFRAARLFPATTQERSTRRKGAISNRRGIVLCCSANIFSVYDLVWGGVVSLPDIQQMENISRFLDDDHASGFI